MTTAEYKDVTELKKQISDFKRMVQSPNSDYLTGYVCALSVTEGMIAGIPTADVVEVRHGEWIDSETNEGAVCSLCKSFFDSYYGFFADEQFKYCPNCGAKMDGKGD